MQIPVFVIIEVDKETGLNWHREAFNTYSSALKRSKEVPKESEQNEIKIIECYLKLKGLVKKEIL